MKLNQHTTQTGFTLVEVLTVMLVLVAIASVTIEVSSDLAFQSRYEVTKDRYEKIKRAIIGRPDVLINGQPDISGFVADMGRLPRNIHELLAQNYCAPDYRISESNPSTSTYTTHKLWCEGDYPTATVKWVEQSSNIDCSDNTNNTQVSCEAAGEVWSGWKGPYIQTQKPDFMPNALTDGWGNEATAPADQNYGWSVSHNAADNNAISTINTDLTAINTAAYLSIVSKGKDGAPGSGTTVYDEDYPTITPSISFNDWTVDINGITANIITQFTPSASAPFSCDLSSVPNGFVCTSAGWDWPGSYKCSVDPATYTDKTSCESNSGLWQWQPVAKDTCSDGISADKAACNAAGGSWGECTKSTETTVNTSKNYCEINGGSWSFGPPINLCIKITRNGNDYKTQSSFPSIEENGTQQIVEFNNTYYDQDSDSTFDMGENRMPIGEASITINSPDCASTSYRGVSPKNMNFYPNTTIPIINW